MNIFSTKAIAGLGIGSLAITAGYFTIDAIVGGSGVSNAENIELTSSGAVNEGEDSPQGDIPNLPSDDPGTMDNQGYIDTSSDVEDAQDGEDQPKTDISVGHEDVKSVDMPQANDSTLVRVVNDPQKPSGSNMVSQSPGILSHSPIQASSSIHQLTYSARAPLKPTGQRMQLPKRVEGTEDNSYTTQLGTHDESIKQNAEQFIKDFNLESKDDDGIKKILKEKLSYGEGIGDDMTEDIQDENGNLRSHVFQGIVGLCQEGETRDQTIANKYCNTYGLIN